MVLATTYVSEALTATYNIYLVILSLAIAVIGSGVMLDLTWQVAVASKSASHLWLIGGAIAGGVTIWAMHFIAMLAYQLPLPISYNFSIVLLSMAVAIVGTGIGLFLATRQLQNWWLLLSGSVFVGLSIVAMHFTAMAGMLLQAMPSYNLKLVLLSDVWAIGLSFGALWLAFHQSADFVSYSFRKIGSVILAGVAIDGMHYIAMAGVSFYPVFKSLPNSGIDNYPLALAIGTAILLMLMLALLASCFGQRLSAELARNLVLQESQKQYQNLYDFAPDAYFSIAPDGRLKSVNQFGAASLGYRQAELTERFFWSVVYEAEREQLQQWLARTFTEKAVPGEIELRKVRKDGSTLWGRLRGQLLQEDEAAIELRVICRDITQRKQAEEQLRYSAFHDRLTGLANRALFMECLTQAVTQAKRQEDYLFAVLFLDLDRFKVINDSLGHLVGDQLLLAIANRLKVCLRPADTVARLGGDEFTILLEGIQDTSDVLRVVNRIQEELTLPFTLNGQDVFTSASIGIALSTTGYEQAEDLIRDADTAMYRAKNQGTACYALFDLDMHEQAVTRWQLETDLHMAIERQEFRLQYQPIVSLQSGKLVGFEALVRWQHPQRGWLLPSEFIPVAEEISIISRLCQWVIRQACRQLHHWQLKFPAALPLIISVNLSSRQFIQPGLSHQIEQILQETGLETSSLRLEITEGAIADGATSATAILLQLKALGVQLSIDDFGTGYSSLGRLHRFPLDGLKIDRSFVSGMGIEPGNSEIVEAIVTLAHKIGVDVTAEGVETSEQLALLRAWQCEYGQGYFFSPPLDNEAAEALIVAHPQW